MNEQKNGVYAAISKVMKGLGEVGVGKDGVNTFHKFPYRSIDAIYGALSKELTKANLLMLPRVVDRDIREGLDTKNRKVYFITLTVEYDLICSDDGSKHTIVVHGEAGDSGDKATNKALSSAFKYAAFQAFCIPIEGSPDADEEEAKQVKTDKPKPKPKKSPPKELDRPEDLDQESLLREIRFLAKYAGDKTDSVRNWLNNNAKTAPLEEIKKKYAWLCQMRNKQ